MHSNNYRVCVKCGCHELHFYMETNQQWTRPVKTCISTHVLLTINMAGCFSDKCKAHVHTHAWWCTLHCFLKGKLVFCSCSSEILVIQLWIKQIRATTEWSFLELACFSLVANGKSFLLSQIKLKTLLRSTLASSCISSGLVSHSLWSWRI